MMMTVMLSAAIMQPQHFALLKKATGLLYRTTGSADMTPMDEGF